MLTDLSFLRFNFGKIIKNFVQKKKFVQNLQILST